MQILFFKFYICLCLFPAFFKSPVNEHVIGLPFRFISISILIFSWNLLQSLNAYEKRYIWNIFKRVKTYFFESRFDFYLDVRNEARCFQCSRLTSHSANEYGIITQISMVFRFV
jgi:hypothetical protein